MMLLNFWSAQRNLDYANVVDSVVGQVQNLMLTELVPFIVSVSILFSMTKYAIENKKVGMEAKEVIRLIVLSFLLMSYTGLMKGLDSIIDGVTIGFSEKFDTKTGEGLTGFIPSSEINEMLNPE